MIKIAICEDEKRVREEILEKLRGISKGFVREIDLFENKRGMIVFNIIFTYNLI